MLVQTDDSVEAFVVSLRILFAQAGGNALHFIFCLLKSYVWFEQRHRTQKTEAAHLRYIDRRIDRGGESDRREPRLGFVRILKSLGRDSCDGVAGSVERDSLADDARIAAVPSLPPCVTDYDDRGMTRLFVLWEKQPPVLRLRAKHIEEVC